MRLTMKCPGLRPGWFLTGDVEIWYPWRYCVVRMWLPRALYIGVCAGCSAAFTRRGFRVNYEDLRTSYDKEILALADPS